MIIPWQVDVPQERWPFVNWILIAVTTAIFVLQILSMASQSSKLAANPEMFEDKSVEQLVDEFEVDEKTVKRLRGHFDKLTEEYQKKLARPSSNQINPGHEENLSERLVKEAIIDKYFIGGKVRPFVMEGFKITGLFGHMWLHGGIGHLLGNMLFLWIFGNAVCAKIGNKRYFGIYIIFGLISALSHMIFQGGSMIGASGAINGIVGMYLVFFAENDITCVWTFSLIYWKKFTVNSYTMITMWLAFDILGAIATSKGSAGGVAYFAHVGGFASGFAIGILMLKKKWVTMERYEKSILQIWMDRINPPADNFVSSTSQFARVIGYDINEEAKATKSLKLDVNLLDEDTGSNEEAEVKVRKEAFYGGGGDLKTEKPILIQFACSCGKKFKVPAKFGGKTVRCKACQKTMRIPLKAEKQFFKLTCTCGKKFTMPKEMAGKRGRCPRCKGIITISQCLFFL